MNRTAAKDTKDTLRNALRAGCLSREDRKRAEKLLENLDRPARIAAVGHKGDGKSTILNALLGENGMPGVTKPTFVELIYGYQTRFAVGDEHNSKDAKSGCATDADLPAGCEHVVQEAPLPKLKNQSLIEINLPDGETEKQNVLCWMADNADIVIWCTRDFDDAEFSTWSKVPDALKDHSFLALTHADKLLEQGTLSQVATRFNENLADEFLGLYPIAAKHALSACRGGEVADAKLWRASGGEALMHGLEQDVLSGKQADLDFAEILVSRYDPLPTDKESPDATPKSTGVEGRANSPKPEPQTHNATAISPMKRSEAIATALTVLQAPVDEMLHNFENETPEPAIVLDHTAQAAQALATLFMDASTEDSDLNTFRDNVLEYEQMVLLLQLEGTEAAAHDASTALLQLKKEMAEVAYA